MKARLKQAIFLMLVTLSAAPIIAQAQAAAVTLGLEGIVAMASKQQVVQALMAAGVGDAQARAEPLLVKLPDPATRHNVTARFTFGGDKLIDVLFTMTSDDASDIRAQVDRWGAALRKSYGTKLVEQSTSPEGYQLEGWCIAPSVEVSTVFKENLAALEYVVDDFGACRDAPALAAAALSAFMYRLPSPGGPSR